MVEAFEKLPTQSAILDGELVLIDPRCAAHFYRLMAQMRTSSPDESQLMFLAFDLLHQDGVDLRGLPLIERKRDLDRLCRKARAPFLKQVETFPDGEVLSTIATALASKASSASDARVMRAGRAELGQNECPRWKASMPSAGAFWKARASQR